MTLSDDRGVPAQATAGNWLSYVPLAWLIVVMALSSRALVLSLPLLSVEGLPDGIRAFFYASMAAGVVTVVWGLAVLALAVVRPARFRKAFTAWQIAVLIFIAAREIYVLATPAFAFTLASHLWPAVEAAVGVGCLIVIRAAGRPVAAEAGAAIRPVGPLLLAAAALLGILAGAAIGCGVGLLLGAILAEATDVSCFEGGCGYFAAFIGLIGLVVGAVAGAILAVWLVRRRNSAQASPQV